MDNSFSREVPGPCMTTPIKFEFKLVGGFMLAMYVLLVIITLWGLLVNTSLLALISKVINKFGTNDA